VAPDSSWRNLSELDLVFRRSRRRAAVRRRIPPKRGALGSRSFRAGVLAVVLLALIAESIGLETSNAKPPSATKAIHPALGAACPVPRPFRPAFARAAAQTGLPASLLVATAYEESEMDPGALSNAGAQGLLQVMPETARELRAGAGPAANVLAGARYLRQMLDRFGSVELALAAYNAGPTAVERVGAAPSLTTLRYVKNVEARAALLASC
jgi:soluble lytic murein transglycosylase-like protein